jgi:hypothetical protein
MDPNDRKWVWCYYAHSDWYKSNVHAGYLLEPGEPGSISLYDGVNDHGEVMDGAMFEKFHESYAQHITAEEEEQKTPGQTRWVKAQGREANHYLDATYLSLVALSIVEHLHPSVRMTPAEDSANERATLAPAAREAKRKPRPKSLLDRRSQQDVKKPGKSWASKRKRRSR